LNIIHGKEDGSYFDPEGTVTRAELAKMICAALGGGTEPVLGDLPTSYPDTASHWAARYIEYCTVLGIVSGRGNGLFDPNAAVTGTEAAKMLLTAIGYSAAEEGYTGGAWAIAVNIRAGEKHLYAGLEHIVPSAPLTRDSAARMVCNALETGMVEYTYQLAIVNGVPVTVAKAKEIVPLRTILSHCYQPLPPEVCLPVFRRFPEHQRGLPRRDREASFTTGWIGLFRPSGQYVRVFSDWTERSSGGRRSGKQNGKRPVNTLSEEVGRVRRVDSCIFSTTKGRRATVLVEA
jgi:hypothetical protein